MQKVAALHSLAMQVPAALVFPVIVDVGDMGFLQSYECRAHYKFFLPPFWDVLGSFSSDRDMPGLES